MSQLAAAIALSGKRLQSYAREIVRLAKASGNVFRQFNSGQIDFLQPKHWVVTANLLLNAVISLPFRDQEIIECPIKDACLEGWP